MSYEKGYEKEALKNQVAILDVMKRVEAYSNASAQMLDQIQITTIDSLKSLDRIAEAVIESRDTLKDIRNILLKKTVGVSNTPDKKSEAAMTVKDRIDAAAKNMGETAKNIILLAGAMVVFALALGLIANVAGPSTVLKALPFLAVMTLIVAGFMKMAEALSGVPKEAIYNAALSIIMVAGALVATAYIFELLPDNPVFPNPLWVLGAGFAILVFSLSMGMLIKAGGVKNYKEVLVYGALMLAIAGAIVGIAYIFQALPPVGPENAPSLIWSLVTGLAVAAFSFGMYALLKGLKDNKLGLKDIILATLAMIGVAAAIVAIAYIFQALPETDPSKSPDLLWALGSGLAVALFATGMYLLLKGLNSSGLGIKEVALATLAMIGIAGAIVAIAYIFQMLPATDPGMIPGLEWSLKAGLALALFTFGFVMIAKYAGELSLKKVILTALSLVAIAGTILAAALIFQYLPGNMKYPPVEWSMNAGLSMAIFGTAFVLVSKMTSNMSIGDLLKGAIATIGIAAIILAVAWIFNFLPEDMKYPSLGFSVGAGVGLGVMAVVIGAVGLIVQGITPAGFLLGALGVLVAALVLVGVAWIFTLLPESLFEPGGIIYKATDAMVYFGNGVIGLMGALIGTVLNGFKTFLDTTAAFFERINAVGAGNIIALAGAIGLMAGALGALGAAAGAGAAVAGVGNAIGAFGSLVGKATSAVGDFLFGSDEGSKTPPPSSPYQLVMDLANRAEAIKNASDSILLIPQALNKTAAAAKTVSVGFQDMMNPLIGPYSGTSITTKILPELAGYKATTGLDIAVIGMKGMELMLGKLVTYQKPLEKLAGTFKDIKNTMGQFVGEVNKIDVIKMGSLKATFDDLIRLGQPTLNPTLENVKQIVEKLVTLEEEKNKGSEFNLINTGGGESKEGGGMTDAQISNLANQIAVALSRVNVTLYANNQVLATTINQ